MEELLGDVLSMDEQRELAATAVASLSVQRHGEREFALDFEFNSLIDDERVKNSVSLIAEPNQHPCVALLGAAEAQWMRAPDEAMLNEVEEFVLSRLGIVRQAAKRPRETVFVVIWEVPFSWQIDLTALQEWWVDWCAKSGVVCAVLLPVNMSVYASEPQVPLLSVAAQMLFPRGLDLSIA